VTLLKVTTATIADVREIGHKTTHSSTDEGYKADDLPLPDARATREVRCVPLVPAFRSLPGFQPNSSYQNIFAELSIFSHSWLDVSRLELLTV
jgi:hypothetical protein